MASSRRAFLGGSAAALWAASSFSTAEADTLTEVRFGSIGGLSDAGLYVAQELGFFKEQGLSLQQNRMADGAALSTSLATNQLDVAGISVTPAVFAAVAQGLNIKIVGDKQSYKPGISATQFVVRTPLVKDTKADTIKNLSGKLIGVSSQKSVAFMQVENLLQMYGVDPTNARYINLQYPEMALALKSGGIDAAQIIEPFLTESIDSKSATIVSDMIEARGPIGMNTTVPLIYSEKFAENHKVGVAFMVAYMKGVRAYIDAIEKDKNKDQIYEVLAKYSKMPVSLIGHVHLPYLDPNQKIDPAAFEEMQKYFLKKGWVREEIDINKLVDTSFSTEAVKQLGPYA